jgi:hypothetical protein
MPVIKTIAATKTKSGNYSDYIPNRKNLKSNSVKAKNGRVKKKTTLTATFSPSSYGKVGLISIKPKLL